MTRSHHVWLYLKDFEGDLDRVSRHSHVWLVHSEKNTPKARAVWGRHPEDSDRYPYTGVTLFNPSDFLSILSTVDEHHDDAAAELPWTVIRVRGVWFHEVDEAAVKDQLTARKVMLRREPGGFDIVRDLRDWQRGRS